MNLKLLFVVLLLVMLASPASSWFFRRRRRPTKGPGGSRSAKSARDSQMSLDVIEVLTFISYIFE